MPGESLRFQQFRIVQSTKCNKVRNDGIGTQDTTVLNLNSLFLPLFFFAATLLSFLLLGIFLTLATAYNGQDIYAEPNCAIVEDHARKFRDISDPTHYWVCPEGQEKADYIQCPDNYAFMEPQQECVVWEEWKWIEPYTK